MHLHSPYDVVAVYDEAYLVVAFAFLGREVDDGIAVALFADVLGFEVLCVVGQQCAGVHQVVLGVA